MAVTKQEPVNIQPTVCKPCVYHWQSHNGWVTPLRYAFLYPSQSTVPMSAGGNKNALNRPVGPDGKRDWSYGLFDCFSACGLCA